MPNWIGIRTIIRAVVSLYMAVSRHRAGVIPAIGAFASQIHPVFMAPPVASSLFGALFAPTIFLKVALLHMLAVFFAVYTAHVKDGYVDFYLRGEDDDHPLTEYGCKIALGASTVGFFSCVIGLWVVIGPGAALITLPGWFIGYFHAPQLDTNPISATGGYPLGIALALVGGYYVQAQTLSPEVVAFGGIFMVILSGIKVIDDLKDHDYDRSISKKTAGVVLGVETARRAAYAIMGIGLLSVVFLSGLGLFPSSVLLAVVSFVAVGLVSQGVESEFATMALVRGAYLFLVLLIIGLWSHPVGVTTIVEVAGFVLFAVLLRGINRFDDELTAKVLIRSVYVFIVIVGVTAWVRPFG